MRRFDASSTSVLLIEGCQMDGFEVGIIGLGI